MRLFLVDKRLDAGGVREGEGVRESNGVFDVECGK